MGNLDALAALRRRQEAARRLPALPGGSRDPDQYWPAESMTDRAADAFLATAEHLFALGVVAAPDADALRVLWRRGGRARDLVAAVVAVWEVVA